VPMATPPSTRASCLCTQFLPPTPNSSLSLEGEGWGEGDFHSRHRQAALGPQAM
jgi:hypothetical protein